VLSSLDYRLIFLYLSFASFCVLSQNGNTDVEDIKFVVNYDYPACSEDYVHRIGRTARSNNTGTAYTFFTPENVKQTSDLISVLREAKQQVNPKLEELSKSGGFHGKGRWFCSQIIVLLFIMISLTPSKTILLVLVVLKLISF
jgi:hypothetical protein